MSRFKNPSRGVAAVEYALVLTFLTGLIAPIALGMTNGADAAVTDSADKIGQAQFTDAEDRATFNPTASNGNYNSFALYAGDNLTETGILDDDDAFTGGVESGPHTLAAGEILVVSNSPSGGTLIVGPAVICSVLLSHSPPASSITQSGSITVDFPTQVLGWISDTNGMIATDAQYGVPGGSYSTQGTRGYEGDTDSVTANSTNSLTLVSVVGGGQHMDQVRVFVDCAATP